jgi:Na+-transporting NADH:ubiquinone oxidoreductase subunit A
MVWTVGIQDVAMIGSLFTKGIFDASRTVALSGAPFNATGYLKTYLGANIGDLTKGRIEGEKIRFVSGDVLSGHEKSSDQFVDWRSEEITALKEGDYYEMFGWLLALKARPSISKTYPTSLIPGITYEADTNTHGEQRAFVVTGQYESVLPMDIYPQQLFKSIVMKDIEQMEGLGIKELSEEDVALCEFVCTSKQPLQHILREGLDIIEEQS